LDWHGAKITEKDLIKLNKPIREQVASIIRREIITERLKSGQQIVERAKPYTGCEYPL